MAEVQEGDILAGKYRVERILGEGGMGFVVAATHITLQERVALKFMRADALGREDGVERFLREARAVVRLKSEHVARVLDVGTLETGAPYIVMEHLEGSDLSHVLEARGLLPLEEAVDYLLQTCDAIAEAHSRGIIHRDLKPANLFVTYGRDGAPLIKVLDFGISKVNMLGDRPESMTQSATMLGSPVYMSPEQMKSSRDVSPTTDIWSLGIILYECVGGRVPFDEQTMGALMARVLTEAPPPLGALRPDLPAEFVAVVERCLQKDTGLRYASVADFAVGLAPFAPPGAEERIARIVGMDRSRSVGPASIMAASSRFAREHPSISAVAATQALPSASGVGVAPASQKGRGGLYALIGLVGLVIAGAAFMGTRSAAEEKAKDGKSAANADGSNATAATVTPNTEPSSVPAASAEPIASTPATASALPSSAPEIASVTPTTHPKPPSGGGHPPPHASAKPSSTPSDPFGTSRQ
jgi:serine/threonine protein kinase